MAKTAKRQFTDEFKREAVALTAIGPENTEQACDVYSEIEVTHRNNLSVQKRSQLLDRRLSLKCLN